MSTKGGCETGRLKLGAIPSDLCGPAGDFEHALSVMREDGLLFADIEWVWGKRVGTHTDEEAERLKQLLERYGIRAAVIGGFTFRDQSAQQIELGDETYRATMEELRAQMALAKRLDCTQVRCLTFSRQMAIWGYGGAEIRNAYHNRTWPKMLRLFEEAVGMAEEHKLDLLIETGVNTLLTSSYLTRRFVEDMGSSRLKVLWDPANTLFHAEVPFPDAYEELRDVIGHIHIKDGTVDIRKSAITSTAVGEGSMAHLLEPIATALRRDRYAGVISLENFYIPENGTLEEGYRRSVPAFKRLFG